MIQTGGASLRVVISYRFERIAIHIANPERSSFARFRVMARGIREARKQLTSFLSIDVADTFSYRTISNREYPKVIKLRENLYFFSFFFIHTYIYTHIYIFFLDSCRQAHDYDSSAVKRRPRVTFS